MAYTRLHWVESETPLSAQNMNNIEDGIEELKSQKVDKVSGKALSDQNYTAAEKTKLAGIEAGAEVNVQSDWTQTNTSADDYIQNKPVNATTSEAGFMSAADKTKLDGVQAGAQVNRTYTAVTGKPTAAASPGFGGTVTVSQVAQSATGQVSVTDRVITIPSSDATTSAHGLMTAADKTKLNGIAAGAQVNPGNATTSAAGLMSAADKTKLNGIATGATKTPSIKVQNSTATDDILNIVFSAPLTVTKEQTATTGASTTKETIGVSNATTSANGLMSSADKAKLDSIEEGAKSIKTIELTIAESVTIAANSLSTSGPKFWSTALSGKTILGYRSLKLWDSSGSAATIIAFNMTLTKNGTTGAEGIILWAYNPTSASITIKDTSKCTIIYV